MKSQAERSVATVQRNDANLAQMNGGEAELGG